MGYFENFLVENLNECLRIGMEEGGLVIRPLSSLVHSMLLNPGYSKDGDLTNAVENFDSRNDGFDLTGIINSSEVSRDLLRRLLREQVHIENKIIQPYALFDVEMFEGTPLFRYTLGIMPEYVRVLEREDIENRVGLDEFGGILHRGVHPHSLSGAYQQQPTNYARKLGFD